MKILASSMANAFSPTRPNESSPDSRKASLKTTPTAWLSTTRSDLTPTPTLKLRAARSIALEVGYTSPSQFAQVFRPALRRAITGGSVEKKECKEVLW